MDEFLICHHCQKVVSAQECIDHLFADGRKNYCMEHGLSMGKAFALVKNTFAVEEEKK
jgi:hypothetical protein